ncbi:perilipin-2-like [Eucyclogobius newberryi]|uniref:perilipin-2-like n=1 Tax=Eucyclogobius newberryi TaxID=166745 RepID=UPI003B59704F
MPLNNNQRMIQKGDSAAARVARLPVVRSAWSRLTVLYAHTKCSRPNLKIICDALEDRAVNLCTRATHTISPVMGILEPHISIANDIACRSLDWLESTFPMLQAQTEEIVAVAKDKLHEAQEMMSVVAVGTKDTMEHAVNKVLLTGGHSSPFIKRAVTVAGAGLDHALNMSEALVDRMLPPAVEEKEEAGSVEWFDSSPRRTYPERLQSVSTRLCMGSYKAMETLARSPSWGQGLQTCLSSFISRLPLHLQHQALTVLLFISQMYSLSCPSPQTNAEYTHLSPATGVSPTRKDQLTVVQWQESPTWRMRLPKTTDCGCKEMCSITT